MVVVLGFLSFGFTAEAAASVRFSDDQRGRAGTVDTK